MDVGFTKATRPYIREVFIRMYSQKVRPTMGESEDPVGDADNANGDVSFVPSLRGDFAVSPLGSAQIEAIADGFANVFEDREFSPAEIQGFLLKHKYDPSEALRAAPDWRDWKLKHELTASI